MTNTCNPALGGGERQVSATQRALALAVAASVFSLTMTQPAAAQDVAGLIDNVIGILNGGVVRGLAIIAVMLMGIAAWFGQFSWPKVAMVVFGMVLVFGAAEIVSRVSAAS